MQKKVVEDIEHNERDDREIHDLGEHIFLFEKCFSRKFCEECIEVFETSVDSGLSVDRLNQMGASNLSISDEAVVHRQIPPSSLPLVQPLMDTIQNEILPEFFKKYPIEHQYNWVGLGGAKMQKTLPQQGYHNWHMEHSCQIDSYRSILAWGLFLNDVEEGGELEFLYQSKRIKPQQGDFVLWPSGFTHQHRGNPPLTGVKYIYTGWIDTI